MLSVFRRFRYGRLKPAKIVACLVIGYFALVALHSLAEIVFLRRLRTNPRYVSVSMGDDGEISRLDLYKQSTDSSSKILCVDTSVVVPPIGETATFPICVHDPVKDMYISQSLIDGVLYEHDYVRTVLRYLHDVPDSGLLDVGANLGVYSLAAARMGVNVVSVEALPENVLRLKTSTHLGNVKDHVKIINAVVSNQRTTFYPKRNKRNLGGTSVFSGPCAGCDNKTPIPGMYLDDLLDNISFTRGVLKMDIEGSEERALEHADRLLQNIDFFAILMEWRFYLRASDARAQKMIHYFTSRNYSPCEIVSGKPLHVYQWKEWDNEILWTKNTNAP